jgi:Lon protease-like protein
MALRFFWEKGPDMADFSLPLFPLQAVLFPGGVLPLRVFEVRYLDLVNRCYREGAPFGVVCLSQGSEVRQPRRQTEAAASSGEDFELQAFAPIGTMAHIVELDTPQAGLLLIRCTGGRRFQLSRSKQLKHGLWVGDAQWLPDDLSVSVPPDLVHVRLTLQRLMQNMQVTMSQADALPLQPPYHWDDCGWLANRWSEILPVSPQLKQQFMALDNPLVRLELVADLLDKLKISRPSASA